MSLDRNLINNLKNMNIFGGRGTSLDILEEVAKLNKCIPVPASCIDPSRKKQLSEECSINVLDQVFYIIRENEVTHKEYECLLNYR